MNKHYVFIFSHLVVFIFTPLFNEEEKGDETNSNAEQEELENSISLQVKLINNNFSCSNVQESS